MLGMALDFMDFLNINESTAKERGEEITDAVCKILIESEIRKLVDITRSLENVLKENAGLDQVTCTCTWLARADSQSDREEKKNHTLMTLVNESPEEFFPTSRRPASRAVFLTKSCIIRFCLCSPRALGQHKNRTLQYKIW